MKIYNSLTKRKEEFIPLEGNKVKMYACGITVSGEAHIGHAYQALIYDIMRKYLKKLGYDVTYAAITRTWTIKSSPNPTRRGSPPTSTPKR